AMDRPIEIGRLQRYAVETAGERAAASFVPATETDKHVAIVGAGPAGLACAAELRRAGVGVTLYDTSERAGGLSITESSRGACRERPSPSTSRRSNAPARPSSWARRSGG